MGMFSKKFDDSKFFALFTLVLSLAAANLYSSQMKNLA